MGPKTSSTALNYPSFAGWVEGKMMQKKWRNMSSLRASTGTISTTAGLVGHYMLHSPHLLHVHSICLIVADRTRTSTSIGCKLIIEQISTCKLHAHTQWTTSDPQYLLYIYWHDTVLWGVMLSLSKACCHTLGWFPRSSAFIFMHYACCSVGLIIPLRWQNRLTPYTHTVIYCTFFDCRWNLLSSQTLRMILMCLTLTQTLLARILN